VKFVQLRLRATAAGLAIILPLFASASRAQNDANNPAARTIEVDGSGETRTSPDTADLDLAIDTHAKTAEQAANLNAALATKVIDALKSKLGDKGKITTGGYSLNPDYSQRPSENPVIVGYNAQNAVTVHTGALDLVGPLIDSAIAAGANRVNSLDFSVKDDARARADAYVLTQGYALTSLVSYYGDPAITVVQPEQRMRWIFEPAPPETLFAAPGLALGEPGRRFDLILAMRFRKVEPAGLIERRGAGGAVEDYELYRVADPYAPVLDPVCPRGEVDLDRKCPS